MKIYIFWCVPAEILYLGKLLFMRYRPKYSQIAGIFKSVKHFHACHACHSCTDMQIVPYLHVSTNSQKLKVVQNVVG